MKYRGKCFKNVTLKTESKKTLIVNLTQKGLWKIHKSKKNDEKQRKLAFVELRFFNDQKRICLKYLVKKPF